MLKRERRGAAGETRRSAERQRTRTVRRTDVSRGKSATPSPSVLTEDSRKESDVRSEATHSPYVDTVAPEAMIVAIWSACLFCGGVSARGARLLESF